jgi:hypothetical protein
MLPAPVAVQIVECILLTEGYKNSTRLFHKLFLCHVENFGKTAGGRAFAKKIEN